MSAEIQPGPRVDKDARGTVDTGRRAILGGVAAGFAAIATWETLKTLPYLLAVLRDPIMAKSGDEITNAINAQFNDHYAKFVGAHKDEFWKGDVGIDLNMTTLSVVNVQSDPFKITFAIFEHKSDNDGSSANSLFEHTVEIKKDAPFDYKRDFETPLLEKLAPFRPKV